MVATKKRTAIFISGRGSNMTAILDAAQDPNYPADIALVLSNNPDAKGLEVAANHGIKTVAIDHRPFKGDRAAFDAELHKALLDHDIELVVLAGFMRILTAEFVGKWQDRMINIHPSLLPSFKGLHTYQRALETGCRLAGCTVHFVRADMDSGPIICQAAVPVLNDDTEDSLAKRILVAEHEIYPRALARVASSAVKIEGMRVIQSDDATDQASQQQAIIW